MHLFHVVTVCKVANLARVALPVFAGHRISIVATLPAELCQDTVRVLWALVCATWALRFAASHAFGTCILFRWLFDSIFGFLDLGYGLAQRLRRDLSRFMRKSMLRRATFHLCKPVQYLTSRAGATDWRCSPWSTSMWVIWRLTWIEQAVRGLHAVGKRPAWRP